MQIPAALRDALGGRVHLLSAALEQAGHLPPGRGLSLDDRELRTIDDTGNRVDLSPAAQAFVNAWTAPGLPATPDWGADLLGDDQMAEQIATAVQQIRAYRALSAPTESQRKQYENLIGRIALHYLRTRFPTL